MGQLFAVEVIYRGVFQKTLAKNITARHCFGRAQRRQTGHFLWPLWRMRPNEMAFQPRVSPSSPTTN